MTPEQLRLEPLVAAHAVHLETLLADRDVPRFTRVPEPVPPGFADGWGARYEEGRAAGTMEGFAAFDPADGAFLGLALVPEMDREARQVELGYLVAPPARGRGVAVAMLRWLTRWAFEEAGALRAVLLIDVDNVASQRVAERCGYVLEGVARSLHLKQDLRTDTQIWSRLPSDPARTPT